MVTESFFIIVQGRKLEIQRITGSSAQNPVIVFMHEGLGSISTWRDFPQAIAARTGYSAIVYSRYGYGNSEVFSGERQVRYMHDEALHVLPELLEKLNVSNPVLLGHSDGASIAIIYAGASVAKVNPAKALILLAPHVFVEDLSIAGIVAAKAAFERTNFGEKLARYHRDPASTFWGWNRIWLNPEFAKWNIEEYLPQITCPVLAIQGMEDQYGTQMQIGAIERLVPARFERVIIENCRHSLHRDQPKRTLEVIGDFLDRNRSVPKPQSKQPS